MSRPSGPVFRPSGSHTAVIRAADRLAAQKDCCIARDLPSARFVVGTADTLCQSPLPSRSFRIFRQDDQIWFLGDRPRSVLAGVLYYLHHLDRGTSPPLPIARTSPFPHRLIVEDFPFHCYQPTGFDFDSVSYAENLVALGYTSMECNRFSRAEPMKQYFDSYLFTNPSPTPFVWTPWHEGVWDRQVVEANAGELRACIDLALSFDLEPSVTTFLPRPYPEAFFVRHPHLRGPSFRHDGLTRGNHPALHRIDTDHPDGIGFYRAVYSQFLAGFPEIRHFFFWHADQGTGFWPDGQGSSGRRTADRIIEFHAMFEETLRQADSPARVWINPWAMAENDLDAINDLLSPRVGFAVKDNTRVPHFCGTTLSELPDLTIISAQLGGLFRKIRTLADRASRPVCLCQYQDFSEDLDPILGVPHPLLTFRKFRSLHACGAEYSATNWGVISPDAGGSRVNQDVIRECTWGMEPTCFEDVSPLLLPASLGEDRSLVANAWRKIDAALLLWPQFWGLRLQDGGMRFRWLIKPLLLPGEPSPSFDRERLLQTQIYHIDSPSPLTDYLDLSHAQAREVAATYSLMIDLLTEADTLLRTAAPSAPDWTLPQIGSLGWLRLFFTTYRNLLCFHSLPVQATPSPAHLHWRDAEMENTSAILRHLRSHRDSLVIARRGAWGQCFGPDIEDDFHRKLAAMRPLSPLNLAP